jgi:hypothetical protein
VSAPVAWHCDCTGWHLSGTGNEREPLSAFAGSSERSFEGIVAQVKFFSRGRIYVMGALQAKVGKVREMRRRGDGAPLLEVAKEAGRAALDDDIEIVIGDEGDESVFRLIRTNPRFGIWVEYLESRHKSGIPVYVEADTETGEVYEVIPTYLYTVEFIETAADGSGLEVSFFQSPAVSPLRGSHPKFEELRKILKDAWEDHSRVLVTCTTFKREIVDVRPAPVDLNLPGLANGPVDVLEMPLLKDVLPFAFRELLPASFISHLTISQALEAFDFVAAIPELQIPFRYPTDCCMARAHLMCRRLLEQRGITARKIWNYGTGLVNNYPNNRATLRFVTDNDPEGYVLWRYHVAPVVSVPELPSKFLVLDPSTFPVRPVPVETWLQKQNDPTAVQNDSSHLAYELWLNGHQVFVDSTNPHLTNHKTGWESERMKFFFPLAPG